jgi:hypothetical protein
MKHALEQLVMLGERLTNLYKVLFQDLFTQLV